jgi:hypothetical protein
VPLTVLNVAYPLAPVGPGCVGGAEEIVRILDAGLVARGHQSIVIAQEGSVVQGTLVPIRRLDPPFDERVRREGSRLVSEAIAYARRQWPVDIVHFHGLDFHECLAAAGDLASAATLHLPVAWYGPAALRSAAARVHLLCVSASQQRSAAAAGLHCGLIENGVAVARPPDGQRREYVVALGRICPEKSFHEALDAARLADVEMVLAGRTFPFDAHVRYFRDEIAPRLDGRRRFIGPVNARDKARLIGSARCVLISSRAPETSSLVAMEALALGAPVVAFPSGALADIVEHGRTGFLVNDASGMAEALKAVQTIDGEACRTRAAVRFSADRMTDDYVRSYEALGRRGQDAARLDFPGFSGAGTLSRQSTRQRSA